MRQDDGLVIAWNSGSQMKALFDELSIFQREIKPGPGRDNFFLGARNILELGAL